MASEPAANLGSLPPAVLEEIFKRIADDLQATMSNWRPEPVLMDPSPYQRWLWETAGKIVTRMLGEGDGRADL